METVREFTYLDNRVSAVGGCEAAVTARTIGGRAMSRECGELLYGRVYSLKLKQAVYKSHVRPAILCGSEEWWQKESEMGIVRRTERSMVRAMCGVQHTDIKRSTILCSCCI